MRFLEVTGIDGQTFALRPEALKSIMKGQDGRASIGIMHGLGHAADIALNMSYDDLLKKLVSADMGFHLILLN